MKNYFSKMKGQTQSPPLVPFNEVFWSWIGGAVGLSLITWIGTTQNIPMADHLFLIGSFGASAVLIYGAPHVTYAQPRNLVGGHVISALIGVLCAKYIPLPLNITGPLLVATVIAAMHLTNTIHPPGGATALIAVMGGPKIQSLGFSYAFMPVAIGALLMLLVALIVNNIPKHRQYPVFWR